MGRVSVPELGIVSGSFLGTASGHELKAATLKVSHNKDTDLLEDGLEDMGRGRGEM